MDSQHHRDCKEERMAAGDDADDVDENLEEEKEGTRGGAPQEEEEGVMICSRDSHRATRRVDACGVSPRCSVMRRIYSA